MVAAVAVIPHPGNALQTDAGRVAVSQRNQIFGDYFRNRSVLRVGNSIDSSDDFRINVQRNVHLAYPRDASGKPASDSAAPLAGRHINPPQPPLNAPPAPAPSPHSADTGCK